MTLIRKIAHTSHSVAFSDETSLSAEKGVTDICSAFFNFRVTKNVTKISVRPIFHSKEMQVASGGNIEDVAKYSLIFPYTL